MSYRRNSSGYPDIFKHAQSTKLTGIIIRELLLAYIHMVDTKPEVDCISESPAMSDSVRNVAIGSGMFKNVGVAVGILSISHPMPEM